MAIATTATPAVSANATTRRLSRCVFGTRTNSAATKLPRPTASKALPLPRPGSSTSPASNAPATPPTVFTATTRPAAVPPGRPVRAICAIHRGRLAPIKNVGSSTTMAALANTPAIMASPPASDVI